MDQKQANILYELQETIKFFGSLIGTPGLSEDNNKAANAMIHEALQASIPIIAERIGELRAQSKGIITG